jgi:hypothetical protein
MDLLQVKDRRFKENTETRAQTSCWSGKRGSNPQPSAWKADALPVELFPHKTGEAAYYSNNCLSIEMKTTIIGGEGRIRTSEGVANRFTVCPLWPLGNLSRVNFYVITKIRTNQYIFPSISCFFNRFEGRKVRFSIL